jgi:hypothetical protein
MSSDEAFVIELLRALDEIDLEAIVVGSMAAIMQGTPITTRDVDLLVRDTPRNREKLDLLGAALGTGRPVQISNLSTAVTLVGGRVPVDVLFDSISGGLGFASVCSRSVEIPLGDRKAVVASLEDVIRSKETVGRPKDLAQLPILRDTLRVRKALES